MSKAKVQIIIPVFNAEKYIRKCLDSVKAQTFEDWQAIIIDDASTDKSADIINEYISDDNRYLYIKQNKNSGVSTARNTALAQLSSEYVAFLDADDYWEPDMLEAMVTKAEEHSCDVVQCRFIYDFPGNRTVLPKGAFDKDILLKENNLKSIYIKMMTGINMNHVCMKLIRTSLLKDARFDTSLKTAEDLKFCVGLFKNVKSYYFINKALYHYCRNEESLTGSSLSFKEKLNANRKASKDLLKALPSSGIDNIFYSTLSCLRPYIIIFSKVFRMIREKIITKR